MAANEIQSRRPVLVWSKRLAALSLWVLFLSYVFQRPVPAPGFLAPLLVPWDFNRRMVVAGVVLVLAFSCWALWGSWSVLRFSLYVLFFPLSQSLLLLMHLTTVLRAPWRFLKWLWVACRSITFLLFLFFGQIYLGALVLATNNRPVLAGSLAGLLILLVLTLLFALSWILSPTWLIISAARKVSLFYLKRVDEAVFEMRPRRNRNAPLLADLLERLKGKPPESEADAQVIRDRIAALKKDASPADWEKATEQLATTTEMYETMDRFMAFLLTPKTVVLSFVPVFMGLFAAIVVAFSLLYLGAWKLEPALFGDSVAAGPNYLDAFFFSMTTITTSAISELRPHTALGKLLVSGELAAGVTLVSLLVLLFSALHASDIEASQTMWSDVREQVTEKLAFLRRVLELFTRPEEIDAR
jgi:hypothetical protein